MARTLHSSSPRHLYLGHHCYLDAICRENSDPDIFRPRPWISAFDAGEFLNQSNCGVRGFGERQLHYKSGRVSPLMYDEMAHDPMLTSDTIAWTSAEGQERLNLILVFILVSYTTWASTRHTHGVISSRHRSGRNSSASGPQRSLHLWRASKLTATKVPLRTKIGDLPSSPPPRGRITSLTAARLVPRATGYNRRAAALVLAKLEDEDGLMSRTFVQAEA